MMIKTKKIPVNQRTFLNQIKTFSKTTNTKEDISKTTIFEVLSKISYRNKISKQPYEATISVQEVTKSVSSQTNNKSSNNYNLTLESYKHFYQ